MVKSSSNKAEVATALPESVYLTQGKAGSLLQACGEGETGGERGGAKSVTQPMECCGLDHLISLVLQ